MSEDSDLSTRPLHIIRERDVGLFSLVQQVVANVPWALSEGRTPVVFFWDRCAYWTPDGMEGKRSVWEYYFEPLVPGCDEDAIPGSVRAAMDERPPHPFETGYGLPNNHWVSSHFGDHPSLKGKAISIPYEWDDPDASLRAVTESVIQRYVRPRSHILTRVDEFFDRFMKGSETIGAHIRGTDAVSNHETRSYRQGSLSFDRYVAAITAELVRKPNARVFIATDSEGSLARMRSEFGGRILAYQSVRHGSGKAAGVGPTGWTMPAYITGDRNVAAQNGAEAVIEYLLLCRCNRLIHNGAGLARTVLLSRADLEHKNVHGGGKVSGTLRSLWIRGTNALLSLPKKILPAR